MARPTRSSRRLPLKYSEEDYVLQSKTRKRAKNISDDNAAAAGKGQSSEAHIADAKGNLYDNKRNISIFGSPVLRDRTNLAKEALKCDDVLMKKGTGHERSYGNKLTKRGAASAALEPKSSKLVDNDIRTTKKRSARSSLIDVENKTAASGKSALAERSKVRVRRTQRRSIESKGMDKGGTAVRKKFFKNKVVSATQDSENISPEKKATSGKRRKIVARDKLRMSNSFRLRQTTLAESFSKQSLKKNLRPRQVVKNYHEDSTLLEKTNVKPQEEKTHERKQPIYKSAKLVVEENDNKASEVYEFQYNSNDSLERIAKKKKKRKLGTRVVTKKLRPGLKKLASDTKATARSAVTKIDEPRDENKFKDCVPLDVQNDVDSSPVANIEEPLTVNCTEGQVAKPTIVECVDLKGDMRINLTVTPKPIKSVPTDSRVSRATSNSTVQSSVRYKTMMNHILLNKSLSPISNALDNFDPGSPWRVPSFANQQFSRVKGVVQSTPYIRQSLTMPEAAAITVDSSIKPASTFGPTINKKNLKKDCENVNVSQQIVDKSTPKKAASFAKSPRKFGTEISNVNVPSAGTTIINQNNDETGFDAFDDNADDKENSAPICPSPKKEKLLNSPRRLLTNPIRTPNKLSAKTNFIPQAGPSGLQKRSPLSESRLLKQSNLNNFLKLDKVPTSTRITTIHGIFDDANTEPICGKPINEKISKGKGNKEANVENAFGFDDDDDDGSGTCISPSQIRIAKPIIRKRVVAQVNDKAEGTNRIDNVPARLSVGEIKRHFKLPRTVENIKVSSEPIERLEPEENDTRPNREENVVPRCGNPVTFSDIFDLSTETTELSNKENPLFADLEPVHFRQPPRHLYKRKRAAACINYSDDEEEDENVAEHVNHDTKRRKVTKVEKQRQKKLDEWAKDLNETFEEIDHFDLIVE